MSIRVFVASPLGFAESTRGFTREIVNKLNGAGYTPVDPWSLSSDLERELHLAEKIENHEERRAQLHRISMAIAERNHEALASCAGVLAVLDGLDVDCGTASEIGFAFASGDKIIHGYRGDFRRLGEGDGVSINLQVQYWIEASGGRIVKTLDEIGSLRFERNGDSAKRD